ncbi:MAG TPA: hypothetical protein VEJ87_06375 [Acidimicrobiales bacterium]|nr:hypothetical protein [Acidimicrobiales bacterium]
MSRPMGGASTAKELERLSGSGVDVLVSLLVQEEAEALGLAEEAEDCMAAGIEFLREPVIDHGVPEDTTQFGQLAKDLALRVRAGEHVAAHCRMGLGRSPLLIGTVLIELGWDVDDAIVALTRARGYPVPETAGQRAWLRNHGDASVSHTLPSWLRHG